MWTKIETEVHFKSYINNTLLCFISQWQKLLWVFVLQDYKDNFREQEWGCVTSATRDGGLQKYSGFQDT